MIFRINDDTYDWFASLLQNSNLVEYLLTTSMYHIYRWPELVCVCFPSISSEIEFPPSILAAKAKHRCLDENEMHLSLRGRDAEVRL
jgi:hypothetical protein